MFKKLCVVFAVLFNVLCLFSCTWPGEDLPRSCDSNSNCLTGYECQNGVCQSIDGVSDVRDAVTDRGPESFEDTYREDIIRTLFYRYARIDDMTPRTGRGAPGVDLDAVELRGPNGPKSYATDVVDSEILLGDHDDNDMMDAEEALGAPDNDCEVDEKFVALGGIGGFIVVQFGENIIEVGDSIVVYEVGESCAYDNDPLALSVSVTNERYGVWEAIGQADGGEAVFFIDHLTPVYP